MSVEAMSWVWGADVPPNAKIVLLAIADHADPYGGGAYPSHERLARKTGYTVRQVKRIIDGLAANGVLRVSVGAGGVGVPWIRPDRRPNLYQIVMNAAVAVSRDDMAGTNGATPELRAEVLAASQGRCYWCNGEGDADVGPDGHTWQVDRLVRGVDGGKYQLDNVVLSCRTCNLSRGDITSRRPDGGTSRPDRGDISADAGGHEGPIGGTPMSPKPSLNHHQEPPSNRQCASAADPHFEAFWSIYPRKIDKKRALKAYNAAKPAAQPLLEGARRWAAYWAKEGTDERFIPHAATWLNNERWNVATPIETGTSDEVERLRELMAPHFEAIDVPLPEADTIRVVAKMCAGPGEVAMRFAVAAKVGTSLESAIDVVRSTQDRVSRFKGDPNPVITGDPVDYTVAMRAARSNTAWRQQ